MPQPISVALELKPWAAAERPELACRIAIITTLWTEIEDEIALLFAYATKAEPAVSTVILGQVNNLNARLDMVEAAIRHSLSGESADSFRDNLRKEIKKRAGERTTVIHCHWTTHKDYPDHLISTRGLTDPQITMWAYSLKDFVDIETRLGQLLISLKEFAQALAQNHPPPAATKSYWQLTEHVRREQD